jgi:hypothetical protein
VKAIPTVVLLSVAVGLGVFLGIKYLRRERSRPVMIGVHLLFGAGGLETFAMLLHQTPNGTAMPAGSLGPAAAGLLAVGMMAGIAAPMIGRRSRRTMSVALATHAGMAGAGFALLIAWMTRGGW